jgi:hypothetical protein
MSVDCYTKKNNNGAKYVYCIPETPKIKKKKIKIKPSGIITTRNNFTSWNKFISKLPYGIGDQIANYIFEGQESVQLGNFLNLPNVKNPIKGKYEDYFQEFDDYSFRGLYTEEDNPPTLFQKQIDRFNYLNKKQRVNYFMKDTTYFNTDFPPNEQREFVKYTQYFAQNSEFSYQNSLPINKYGDRVERPGKFGKIKPPKIQFLKKKDREEKLRQSIYDRTGERVVFDFD